MAKIVKKIRERKSGIQGQLIQKIGEVGYTAGQIFHMLDHLKMPRKPQWSEGHIRGYARRNHLVVDLGELGVVRRSKNDSSRYYIPKSKLVDIVEGLDMTCTVEDLERAAVGLGYKV